MLRVTTIVAPAALPMDVNEAREHVNQDLTVDDAKLDSFIRAARDFAESECNRTIIATRYRATLDGFPRVICLQRGPVLRVRSVQYLDMNGAWQTVATTVYAVDLTGPVPCITEAWGQTWPSDVMPQIGSVRVDFDAGEAAAITAVAATDVLTIKGGVWSALAVDDVVRLSNSGGVLPAPLEEDTDYYLQAVPSSTTFKLSATQGGAAIDITDAGTGTHYIGLVPDGLKAWLKLRIGSMYELTADVEYGSADFKTLPYADAMLDRYRVEFA